MYKLREVNTLLKQEDLPPLSRQMFARMRGISYTSQFESMRDGKGTRRYDSKVTLENEIHYVIEPKIKKSIFKITDEGFKAIREWSIRRKAKDQSKIKDIELAKWIQSNANRLIDWYSDKNGNIDFNRLESVEWFRSFPNMPAYKFNRAVRQALSFVGS